MKKVTDESFKKYGKVISNLDFSDLLEKMNATQVPEDVIYVPSMEFLEKSDVAQKLKNSIYEKYSSILRGYLLYFLYR